MNTAADAALSPRGMLALAAAQVCVIVGLWWVWSSGSSDASSTAVDWRFVGVAAATPVALAISAWIGWRSRKRADTAQPRAVSGAALTAQWTTLAALALALILAPLAIIGAVIFGPMG